MPTTPDVSEFIQEGVVEVILGSKQAYKGIEYTLSESSPGHWDWIFFPLNGDRLPRGGETKGTRDHVEIAVMRAINKWLAGFSSQYETQPKAAGEMTS